MLLSVSVWVESQYAGNLACVYNSVNYDKETMSLLPHVIIDPKQLDPGKTYTQFQLPYDMYLGLLNIEKVKQMNYGDLETIKRITDSAAQMKMETEVIYKAMQTIKQNPHIGIGDACNVAYSQLFNISTTV